MRAVAVHSGETSAPRAQSLDELSEGKLDVIGAVDTASSPSSRSATAWLETGSDEPSAPGPLGATRTATEPRTTTPGHLSTAHGLGEETGERAFARRVEGWRGRRCGRQGGGDAQHEGRDQRSGHLCAPRVEWLTSSRAQQDGHCIDRLARSDLRMEIAPRAPVEERVGVVADSAAARTYALPAQGNAWGFPKSAKGADPRRDAGAKAGAAPSPSGRSPAREGRRRASTMCRLPGRCRRSNR